MGATTRYAVRFACAPLALAVLVGLAVACDGGDEPSPTPTREAAASPSAAPTTEPTAAATPSPAPTAEPTAAPSPSPAPTAEPTVAAPTPPASVSQPEWAIREELSGDTLYVLIDDGLSSDPYVLAADEPEVLEFEQWEVYFAADTDGDDVEEAAVLHYTGGAHCCFEYLFLSSDSGGIQLQDRFSLGNAAIENVEDLDGDGVPELIASDDRLAYFDDLSFAVSPFLPLVLCRSGQGTYVDCTPAFPQFLMDSAGGYEDRLRESVQVQALLEERYAAGLALYFSYLRLGTPEDGEALVKSLCPECWQWLSQYSAEINARMDAEQPFRE